MSHILRADVPPISPYLYGILLDEISFTYSRMHLNWRRGPWDMCILLYVKLLWCSSIPYIYGQLEEGTCA